METFIIRQAACKRRGKGFRILLPVFPPAWPCCCIRRAKWFWDEKYSGPDPWIGGAVGGCDAFFSLQHGIFSRGCDAPECCETICNLLQEEKIARARVPRSAQVDLLSGCAEVWNGLQALRAGWEDFLGTFGLGGYFSSWEDTFEVFLGAAWKEMAQQQQRERVKTRVRS